MMTTKTAQTASKTTSALRNSDLGYLGTDFQHKLVKCFFEDQSFFEDIEQVLDQNMFTSEHLRRIVGIMKNSYNKRGKVPSYCEVEILIRQEVRDAASVELLLGVLGSIRKSTLEGMDIIENSSEKFFKQQNMIKALNKSVEIIRNGNINDYDRIEGLIQNALLVNCKKEIGFQLFENLESDLSENFRQTIPTGCPQLDDALGGGLGRRELGIIVAPAGVGKSSTTTGFAAAAATCKCEANNYQGFKVLHIFFEDEEVSIRRKYYGWLTQIDACDLSKADIRPKALEFIYGEGAEQATMLRDNIRCLRLSSGENTASSLKPILNKLIALGFKPDLIITDYFECLAREKGTAANTSEWSGEGITMRKLESMAKEYNAAWWVPVQGTKGSIGQEYVGVMNAGGSVQKIQIGHVIIQLAQTKEQKINGMMNVFIGKLRAVRMERDTFTNVHFNNGTGRFDMDNSGTELTVDSFPQMPQTSQNMVAQKVAAQNGVVVRR